MTGFERINFAMLSAIAFAVLLQIHIILFSSPDYLGLRISAADLILPLACLIIAGGLFNKLEWPQFRKPFGWWALALPTLALTMALVRGYFVQGGLHEWAFINKYIGWYVLMAYFFAGAWFATHYREQYLKVFFASSFVFFLIVACGEILIQIFKTHNIEISTRSDWQSFEGLMTNRNSYAFLFLSVIIFSTLYFFRNPSKWIYALWILVPIITLFTSSRMLYACLFLIIIFFAVWGYKKTFRFILPSLIVGTAVIFILFTPLQIQYFSELPFHATKNIIQYAQNPENPDIKTKATQIGNSERLQIFESSLTLIKKYPTQGAGLGSSLFFQSQTIQKPNVIDNTLLWITTEMGLVGLLAFVACYISMLVALIRNKSENDYGWAWAMAMTLLMFGIFSLFHEILYTRALWFALGLTLAIPKMHPDGLKS